MSNISPRRPALNIPLLALWAASIGVAVLGYTLLQRGNAGLAAFYAANGSDYNEFLGLQSQGTVGGMLLTAGVVGAFIALATHARNRAARLVAASTAGEVARDNDRMDDVLYIEDLDEIDESTDAAPRRDAPVAASPADATVPAADSELDGAASGAGVAEAAAHDVAHAESAPLEPESAPLEPASARG